MIQRISIGCAVVAFTALDLAWLNPAVFEAIAWNAYFPVPVLIAAIAVAFIVALGRLAWWWVLVLLASVVAQCHLAFVIPAFTLVLLAPAIALTRFKGRNGFRWLLIGAIAGFFVWLAPFVQDLASDGNLSALAGGESGTR